jgi:alditol oxidase
MTTPENDEPSNWAGNYTYHAQNRYAPTSLAELQELVRNATGVKALGTRHSFNDIADSPETQVSLEHFTEITINEVHRTVTVGAGVTYATLAARLHEAGLALHNMASLPHISVAGAVATGTHGSGVGNGNLATAVVGVEMVTGTGEVVTLSREKAQDRDRDFAAIVVGLGALGVVTRLTLEILPTFLVRQDVYENLPITTLLADPESVLGCAYSVSLFTDWQGEVIDQVWCKSVENGYIKQDFAPLATHPHHPLDNMPTENCTAQLGVWGPWHERLPHFRPEFTPSNGAEIQSEYFVARADFGTAFQAIRKLRDQITPLLYVTEIRTVAQDDLWLSPHYERDSVAFHFTWQPNEVAILAFLPTLEAALAPFAPRPHWGKVFTMAPEELATRYPRWQGFRDTMRLYDPYQKFGNGFLERCLL